jgi:hypothetical protein
MCDTGRNRLETFELGGGATGKCASFRREVAGKRKCVDLA